MKKLISRFEKYTVNKNNVYIVPTKKGIRFTFINFSLFVIALAYTNNMALLISFISFVYFIIQMLEIHRIIQNSIISSINTSDFYQGEDHLTKVTYSDELNTNNRSLIKLSLLGDKKDKKDKKDQIKSVLVRAEDNNNHHYSLNIKKRGHYKTNRVKISTTGTSGLFYVWRYFKFDLDFYSYPKKQEVTNYLNRTPSLKKINFNEIEFLTHIPYSTGQSSKRIDWKIYARRDELYIKKHIDKESKDFDLNYSKLKGSKEEKLSKLSYLVNLVFKSGHNWKLTLPNMSLPISQGTNHLKKSLELLSEF